MNAQSPQRGEMLARLDAARVLLETNQVESARNQAYAVLKTAEEHADRPLQAQALMALAQYDRVLGRFRRAVDAVQRAAQIFQIDGNLAAECEALSLLAHANSYLGRDAEAVEAGLLSVKLGDLLPPGPGQVTLYNYLGVAYLWSKSFGEAEAALRQAERLALLYPAGSNVLLPRMNLAWLEAVRMFKERYFTGTLPGTATLQQRMDLCDALFDGDTPFPGLPGVRSVLQRFGRCVRALLCCWHGEFGAAQSWLDAAQDPSRPGHYAQVANFVVHWVRAELHWAQHDAPGARREAALLIERAAEAEFEQMAYIGHLLLIQIDTRQGQLALALREERRYRERQLRVRADGLQSRHRVVQAQLDIRASARDLQRLAQHANELERLSFEDTLTGIANRRRFEAQLATALAGMPHPRRPTCVAVIDLDAFKSINDRYSHAAGDEVLRTVAQAIRAAVRDSDLPARLGGDEFVVLFAHTQLAAAEAVCARIEAAVAALRWDRWPDLRVGVSIGVAESAAEDTAAGLLLRSDQAMFKAKGRVRG
ncbi:MAG: hypothetical protein JWP29_4580 [Rhodoferax sp.]|nr:hypothetical protein [Rhodoferax sp.]